MVVSGGAINTPAILLRSELKHPMIGRHLCLHPALVVGGVFPEDYDESAPGKTGGEGSDGGRGDGDGDRANSSSDGSTAQAAQAAGKQACLICLLFVLPDCSPVFCLFLCVCLNAATDGVDSAVISGADSVFLLRGRSSIRARAD